MTGVVALICRLSPRPDGKYEGVQEQEAWGREYAAVTWPGLPVEVYADEGVSATQGDYRPGLEAFLERLAEGAIGHVWAVEQSRVSRETEGRYPWFGVAAEMEDAGIPELHTKHDGIVPVRGEVAGIKAVLAEAETRKLKARLRLDKDRARADGNLRKVFGGPPILGYAWTEGADDWHTDPAMARVIREVAALVLADPEHQIAPAFKAQTDVPVDAAGRVVTEAMMRRALKRPATAGLITDRAGKLTGATARIEGPPLDEATWRELREVFRLRTVGRRVDEGTYWAGPLLRCYKDHNPMSGAKVEGKPYLACRNPHPSLGIYTACRGASIAVAEVEALIRGAVERWAAVSPEFAAASRVRAGQASERDRLAADLAGARRRFSRLAARYGAGGIDDDEWGGIEEQHDATVATIEGQLAGLSAELAAPPLPREVRWERLTGEERRRYAGRALKLPITVGPGGRGVKTTDRMTLEPRRRGDTPMTP